MIHSAFLLRKIATPAPKAAGKGAERGSEKHVEAGRPEVPVVGEGVRYTEAAHDGEGDMVGNAGTRCATVLVGRPSRLLIFGPGR
jgi:hypothetical protein